MARTLRFWRFLVDAGYLRLCLGRLTITAIRYRIGPRFNFRSSLRPERFENGYLSAGGSWVREDGCAYTGSIGLGRFELVYWFEGR